VPVDLVPVRVVGAVLRPLDPHGPHASGEELATLGLVVQEQINLVAVLDGDAWQLHARENFDLLTVHEIQLGDDRFNVEFDLLAALKIHRLQLATADANDHIFT